MAGLLKQPVYNLKNVIITLNTGVLLDCTGVTISEPLDIIDRTSGSSLRQQRVINKAMAPKVEIDGFNTNNYSYADIKPGSKVTAFAMAPTASGDNASFLRSDFFTDWPISGLYIGEPSTALAENESSKWKIPLEFGILASFLASGS